MTCRQWCSRVALLAWLPAMVTACGRAEPEPAFFSREEALRYYHDVQRFFPNAEPPASLLAMDAGDEAENQPAPAPLPGQREEGDEEEENPGPPEIPQPGGVEEREFEWVAVSGNWGGYPKGGRGECPCETDFRTRSQTMFFNADPRRGNPPDPDPGNGLFPAIWRGCLARVPEPAAVRPDHACQEPCDWVPMRMDDWSLYRHANGTWRLTCWKLRIFHCEVGIEP